MAYHNGFEGAVTINGDSFCVSGWEANDENDLQPVTTTCSGGKAQVQKGLRKLTGKIDAFYAVDNRPPAVSGDTIAAVLKSSPSNTVYDISDAVISKIDVKSVVGEIITWTIDFQANTWTDPSTT